jgi:hypothetical protein
MANKNFAVKNGLDVAGNVTLTGDLRVNGNDIQSSTGATAITLSGANVSMPGNLTVDTSTLFVDATNNIVGIGTATPGIFGNTSYPLEVVGATNGAVFTRTSTAANTNNPIILLKDKGATARAVNDGLQILCGIENTTSVVYGAALRMICTDATAASEDYDFTVQLMQNGAAVAERFRVASTGDVTVVGDIRINGNDIQCSSGASTITMTSANTATTIRGDTINLQTAASVAQTSAGISYTRTYGEFAYTAGTITIAAQNTVYAFPLDTTLIASGVTISNTSRVNINVSGYYKIIMSLQTAMEVNSVGQFDFWLRKNGTDVANSATQVDLLKDQKSVVAMDWLVESDGNDYWEIMYASNSANYADLDFPYIAAWTTPTNPYARPAAPPILVNVIPAGM